MGTVDSSAVMPSGVSAAEAVVPVPRRLGRAAWLPVAGEIAGAGLLSLFGFMIVMSTIASGALRFSPDTRRLLAIDRFCRLRSAALRAVFVVGDSVAVEGVDARLMDLRVAPGVECFNLACTGMRMRELVLMLPSLRAASPSAVAIAIDPFGSRDLEIEVEKLEAYRETDVLPRMPAELRSEVENRILRPSEAAYLDSGSGAAPFQGRPLALFCFEALLRDRGRGRGRAEQYATELKDPWQLVRPPTGSRLNGEIAVAAARASSLSVKADSLPFQAFQLLRTRLRASGVSVMAVLWPIHPRVRDCFPAGYLDSIARAIGPAAIGDRTLDLRHLLGSTDFADSVHPNANGRRKVSIEIARSATEALHSLQPGSGPILKVRVSPPRFARRE